MDTSGGIIGIEGGRNRTAEKRKTGNRKAKKLRNMNTHDLVKKGEYMRKAGRHNEAYRCFLESALFDDPAGLKNLGLSYLHGEGVPQDLEKATYYLSLSRSAPKEEIYNHGYSEETNDYSFSLALEALKSNSFNRIVVDILCTLEDADNNFLTIAYCSPRDDRCLFVQAARETDKDTFYVEIGLESDNPSVSTLWRKSFLSLSEAIEIFRVVLVGFTLPEMASWEEIKIPYDIKEE